MTGRSHLRQGRKGVVAPGTRLNHMFEVEELLSAGGMGEVYRGHNILTQDAVAIKIVLPEFAQDNLIVELFRKEARILNHLNHEAIIRYYVFSIDADMGRPFLAMEYVNGPSLSEHIKETPLDTDSVLVLLRRLAGGLQKAHEAGVVHRDIAPDNIILPDGAVDQGKIIDFGIARSAVGGGTLLGGTFAGKYNFVSPEQLGLFGAEVTERSDIYSLGLVVAACVRGHPLDMGGTQFEVVEKRRTVPDLSSIDLPLRHLVEAMLQPDPADRPQSMADIIEWLDLFDQELGREPTLVVTRYPTWAPKDGATPTWVPAAEPSPETENSAQPTDPAAHGLATGPERRLPRILAGIGLAATIVAGVGTGWYYLDKGIGNSIEPRVAGPLPTDTPDLVSNMLHYVREYQGGDCYFAQPAQVSPSDAAIIGFGNRVEPFPAFRDAFQQKFGFVPQLELRLVSDAQCVVVDALGRLTSAAAERPILELGRERLRSGDTLSGTVSNHGNRHVEILLVDDTGLIYNLRGLTEKSGDRLVFSGAVEMAGTELEPKPQLVITIASAAPLQSLAKKWPQGHIAANQLVPELLEEIASKPAEVAATAGYLKIGG